MDLLSKKLLDNPGNNTALPPYANGKRSCSAGRGGPANCIGKTATAIG